MRHLLYAAVLAAVPPIVLAQAPAPATPSAALLQKSEAEVRARLGTPEIARREAGGGMWTYREETCALYVFFKAQGREGMRVSGAAAGPRKRGQANPDVDACITAAAKS